MFKYAGFCCLILCLVGCGEKEFESKQFRSSNTALTLQAEASVPIGSDTDIGYADNFQFHGSTFTLVDPVVEQKCYEFYEDGRFKQVIGGKGQGPGEYSLPTACTISGDRIWVAGGGDKQFHIYDTSGNYLKSVTKEFSGLATLLIPVDSGDVFAMVFSRYAPYTFYRHDKDGALIQEFGETPEEYALSFDTFSPAGNVIPIGDLLYQNYNFAYEVHVYDQNGKKQDTIRLTSSRYKAPDINSAKKKEGNGHKAELDFRGSFTQFNGLYQYQGGFVTVLTGWKDKNTSISVLEFWDSDFNGTGYYDIPEGERFLGVANNRLAFIDNNGEEPNIVFRSRKKE